MVPRCEIESDSGKTDGRRRTDGSSWAKSVIIVNVFRAQQKPQESSARHRGINKLDFPSAAGTQLGNQSLSGGVGHPPRHGRCSH